MKWREKNWRQGSCEHMGKGEEDLTGEKVVAMVEQGDIGWWENTRGHYRQGEATTGDHGNGDTDKVATNRGGRGGRRRPTTDGERLGVMGGVRMGEVRRRGESAAETDEERSEAETDEEKPAVETGDRRSAAETDAGMSAAETDNEGSGERRQWAATVEEVQIFGAKKRYPTDRRPKAFRRELSQHQRTSSRPGSRKSKY